MAVESAAGAGNLNGSDGNQSNIEGRAIALYEKIMDKMISFQEKTAPLQGGQGQRRQGSGLTPTFRSPGFFRAASGAASGRPVFLQGKVHPMALRKDLALVGLIVVILALMVVPMSQGLIDILLATNISLSIVLIMMAVYLKHPSDFSTFPSVILIGTAFRLALSIATTRLILTEADAGQIIETFGKFVVSGSVAVGLVIFLIITVVQFLVVTKGAERVAEVGARFALDALPGRQMSIDNEVRAGSLDAAQGNSMRKQLSRDSQFFGAMDGAMKFVKGDAIAGLIITVINLVGGIVVGVTIHDLSMSGAASTFSLLTVGDGLVAQIPALLMSLCAGIIVTRATNPENADLGTDITRELLADPRVPAVASAVVLAVGFIPGFPPLIFAGAAATLFVVAALLRRTLSSERRAAAERDAAADAALPERAETPVNPRMRLVLGSAFAAEIGVAEDGAEVEGRLDLLFADLSRRTGVAFHRPAVVVDSEAFGAVIEFDEVPIWRGAVPAGTAIFALSMDDALAACADAGEVVPLGWPAFDGVAVGPDAAGRLQALDHAPIAPLDAICQHAFRLYERHLGELFSQREYDTLMADLSEADEGLHAAVAGAVPRAVLFQVFRHLIEDGVPLRPAGVVLDALQYWTQIDGATEAGTISDRVRGSLKRQLCHALAGAEGVLGLLLLDPALERTMRNYVAGAHNGDRNVARDGALLPAHLVDGLLERLHQRLASARQGDRIPAIVTTADLRRRLRDFLAVNGIHIPVFAPHEITPDIRSFPLATIALPNLPRDLDTSGIRSVA